MALKEEVEELRSQKYLLGDNDHEFASSLIRYYDKNGYLTEKQRPYFDSLLERVQRLDNAKSQQYEEVFNGHSIRALLFAAKQNLKYPALKLQSDGIGTIRFYIAGSLAKTPGYIIIDNGRTPPNKVIYGTIESSGTGEIRKSSPADVKSFIRRIASNPISEAKLCGIKFSHCCFCGITLTSPISLHHGYGPICADNWGLPWEGPKLLTDREEELANIKLVDIGG